MGAKIYISVSTFLLKVSEYVQKFKHFSYALQLKAFQSPYAKIKIPDKNAKYSINILLQWKKIHPISIPCYPITTIDSIIAEKQKMRFLSADWLQQFSRE